jgi:hypothetical protein
LADADPERALAFALSCGETIPLLRDFMLRRLGSADSPSTLDLLVSALDRTDDVEQRLAIVRGINQGLSGRRRVKPSPSWAAAYRKIADSSDATLRLEATALGVRFGDQAAMAEFRELIELSDAGAEARRQALKTLLAAKDPNLADTMLSLLPDADLRREAITGLAQYGHPQTPAKLLEIYQSLPADEKRAALATLGSRVPYGVELLKAVAEKQVPITDLSADLVRQLHNLHDATVDKLLAESWGQVRPTAEDKAQLIAEHRELLSRRPDVNPDLELGRSIFAKPVQTALMPSTCCRTFSTPAG